MPQSRTFYVGLSEYSTGERRRQPSITKAGNSHARRVLVEGAWAYRYPAKVSRHVHCDSKNKRPSRTSVGRPKFACANTTDA
jgi:transposase